MAVLATLACFLDLLILPPPFSRVSTWTSLSNCAKKVIDCIGTICAVTQAVLCDVATVGEALHHFLHGTHHALILVGWYH